MTDLLYLRTDSRNVTHPESTVFACVKTSIGDGHLYIAALIERGVRNFIVEYIPDGINTEGINFDVVPSVEKRLLELSSQRLKKVSRGIVITGSHGKTTMKELLFRSMQTKTTVCRSPRSWNSAIGAAQSLWEMTSSSTNARYLITEAAIDGPDQGQKFAQMLSSSHTIGIITSITAEHDESFESHRKKIEEKLTILSGCKVIFYPAGDRELEIAIKQCSAEVIRVDQGRHPTIFHAFADAVLQHEYMSDPNIDSIPLADSHIAIFDGAWGTTVVRDGFTPDLRTLEGTLEFMARRASSSRGQVLVLGKLLHGPHDNYHVYYRKAQEYALSLGFEQVIFCDKEARDLDSYITPDLISATAKTLSGKEVLIFGLESPELNAFADALDAATHDSVLEVDLDALVHNYNYFRHLLPAGTGMMAMVKASAYGMGAVEVGRALQSVGASYLAVAVIEEGIALRKQGITMPIVVLNPITNRYEALVEYHLEPAVFSAAELRRLIREIKSTGCHEYPIHIKLDTGMHRVGFTEEQIPELLEILDGEDTVRVASVFSHLATADCLDKDYYTLGQIERFKAMADQIERECGVKFKRHLLNTAGMLRFPDKAAFDMARLGIGLYGISPYPAPIPLKTVATLRTHIISIKHWPSGTPIGYGCNGVTERDSVIATIPIGYADGINRHLGRGAASFVVEGVKCPTIGNICMDQCMIDVTDVPSVEVGTAVEIFGQQQPVYELAEILDTIPYEIITSVAPRVKRVYITK